MTDATVTNEAFDKIVQALEHQQIVAYFDVLNTTLLMYDVLNNLHIEVKHIWTRKWSYFTVLYILQRYLPFFDTAVVALHHHFGENLSIRYCDLNYKTFGWLIFVGILLSEMVLTLRVWSVWERSTTVAIGLVAFSLVCWVPCFVLLARFLATMRFAPLPSPKLRGCLFIGGSHLLFLSWVLMMVYDTCILVMMLIPGMTAYRRGGRSELFNTLYRDGVKYYVLIVLISITNVVVAVALPTDLILVLTSFERIFHSLLTSHAALHIRQVATRNDPDETLRLSQIQFRVPESENGVGRSLVSCHSLSDRSRGRD
ncbi:hypothetical protein L218DRAFT_617087 [Marasmius fiardii PR-910]|nr:hypothetical protein L218DRAFT_617087 [Marasmius fiardii PR-910]